MEIERETIVEAVVAVIGVGVFIGIAVVAGAMSNGGTHFSETGALTLVGGMIAFIVVMSGIGFYLSTRE
jgi:hypothetical protein